MVVVVFIRERVQGLNLSIDTFAPEVETPVDESAIEVVFYGVLNDDSPFADARLAPVTMSTAVLLPENLMFDSPVDNRHERPVVIACCGLIWTTTGRKITDHAIGAE